MTQAQVPSMQPSSWREHFLLPADTLYLDTAAHAPRLARVQQAAHEALAHIAAPSPAVWCAWIAQIERVRMLAAGLFDGDADAVALVPSVGYGLTLASRSLPLAAGESVLVLADTFPSNLLCWQQRCIETGARLHAVQRGQDATAAVLAALDRDPTVRIVALPHAHWHDGAALDLDAIAKAVHARGAALVLDLSQSLGAWPAAIARWKPAFAVSVGYKWLLGPPGLCYLWADPHWRTQAQPLEWNWVACDARDTWAFPLDRPATLRAGARRFDAGEIADPLRLAMAEAGLVQITQWGVDAIAQRLGTLTSLLRSQLASRGDAFASPAMHAPHLLGLRPRTASLDACVHAVRQAGIACTARHGVLRIAPHLHVDEADIERTAAVLACVV